MTILPAIDLKDGKCVRLYQGDFATAHQVARSAKETAAVFADDGAEWIHMVDLNGARSGKRVNSAIVKEVADTSGLRVELGGGLRSMDDLAAANALGVSRMIIGSAAVGNPEFVGDAVDRYGERIGVGIDALDGRVRTSGWEHDSGLDAVAFAKQMEDMGVTYLIFTDIATDGMLSGPSFQSLETIGRTVHCKLIASGGVTTVEDVRKLRDMGLYGAIIGKAYYAGTIDLAEAITEAKRM